MILLMVSEVYLLTLTYFLTTNERNKMTQTTVTTAVNTIANNAVVTANAESFTNDNANAMLTTNSLSFIELLKNEQEVWAESSFFFIIKSTATEAGLTGTERSETTVPPA